MSASPTIDGLKDLLHAIHEAVDIPHAATVSGDEVRSEVLVLRAIHVKVALDVWEDDPRWIDATTANLRERLKEHPPVGYVTDEEAQAAIADGKTWTEAVTP
jgi:hypothetical protein